MPNEPIEAESLRLALEMDVYTLATPAGRRVGDPGYAAAQRYLVQRMLQLELRPYAGSSFELVYGDDANGTMTNLVGVLPGIDTSLSPVLLGAHYDTCGALPGADDNAAAVAAVLGTVESLRMLRLRRSVVIALFDGEEPPHFLAPTMGSIRFQESQRTGPIATAIVLDLVGHRVPVPGLEDILFVLGAESCSELRDVVARTDAPPGLRLLPALHRYAPDLSDHTAFRRAGRPFLFLTCGRGPDYHEASDTPEKVDYPKLAAVREYLVRVLAGLDGAELAKAQDADTLQIELRGWQRCWTPSEPRLRQLRAPRSREDIDQFAAMLMRLGL